MFTHRNTQESAGNIFPALAAEKHYNPNEQCKEDLPEYRHRQPCMSETTASGFNCVLPEMQGDIQTRLETSCVVSSAKKQLSVTLHQWALDNCGFTILKSVVSERKGKKTISLIWKINLLLLKRCGTCLWLLGLGAYTFKVSHNRLVHFCKWTTNHGRWKNQSLSLQKKPKPLNTNRFNENGQSTCAKAKTHSNSLRASSMNTVGSQGSYHITMQSWINKTLEQNTNLLEYQLYKEATIISCNKKRSTVTPYWESRWLEGRTEHPSCYHHHLLGRLPHPLWKTRERCDFIDEETTLRFYASHSGIANRWTRDLAPKTKVLRCHHRRAPRERVRGVTHQGGVTSMGEGWHVSEGGDICGGSHVREGVNTSVGGGWHFPRGVYNILTVHWGGVSALKGLIKPEPRSAPTLLRCLWKSSVNLWFSRAHSAHEDEVVFFHNNFTMWGNKAQRLACSSGTKFRKLRKQMFSTLHTFENCRWSKVSAEAHTCVENHLSRWASHDVDNIQRERGEVMRQYVGNVQCDAVLLGIIRLQKREKFDQWENKGAWASIFRPGGSGVSYQEGCPIVYVLPNLALEFFDGGRGVITGGGAFLYVLPNLAFDQGERGLSSFAFAAKQTPPAACCKIWHCFEEISAPFLFMFFFWMERRIYLGYGVNVLSIFYFVSRDNTGVSMDHWITFIPV